MDTENNILLTESTKEALIKEFGENVDFNNKDSLLEMVKDSKKFTIIIKENTVSIKQVLNG